GSIDRLIDREQPGLMCKELADSDALFALLRELRPIRACTLVVVEPASRMGNRERHCRQALGRRVDDDHGVLLPGLACLLVPHAAPEIDHFVAAVVDGTRTAQLPASSKVFGKCVAHALEAVLDLSLDVHAGSCGCDHVASASKIAVRAFDNSTANTVPRCAA